MDRVYGHLFDEADVKALLVGAGKTEEEAQTAINNLLENGKPTFNPGEPQFLMLGSDKAAPAGVWSYGAACEELGRSEEKINQAKSDLAAVVGWDLNHEEHTER